MREANGAVLALDDASVERRLEVVLANAGLREQLERRRAEGRDEDERVLRRLREPCEPHAQKPVQRLRHGQRSRRVEIRGKRPRELDRIERISARGLVDAEQRGPGEDTAEPIAQQHLHGAHAQRSYGEPLDCLGGKRTLELGRRPVSFDPTREQQHDRALHPSQGERQRRCRRPVEPLDVVDRDHERLCGGKDLEAVPNGDPQRTDISGLPRTLP